MRSDLGKSIKLEDSLIKLLSKAVLVAVARTKLNFMFFVLFAIGLTSGGGGRMTS
jgi:hypothetical protein